MIKAAPLNTSILIALSVAAAPAGLVALRAVTNDALKGKDLPSKLKLLRWGNNETTKGNVHVGPETVKALAANQLKYGYDRIALDFNHNSLPGHENFQPDPREVAAYGVPSVIEGDGLYLDDIQYTPAGEKFARNYADLSPTPRLNAAGEVDFLHSVALCPQGSVHGLSFFASPFLKELKPLDADSPSDSPDDNTDMDYKKLLITMLGLSEDAQDSEIEEAAKAMAQKGKETKDAIDKGETDKPDKKDDEPSADAKAMAANLDRVTRSLLALTAKIEAGEREAVLNAAVRDGKIVPLSARKLPISDLTALVAELPANQVPLEQRTPENLAALSAKGYGADTASSIAMKQLGISKEDWDKYGKDAA